MSAAHAAAHGAHHGGSYLTPKGGFITTVWDWMTTVDHKKIGVMYLFAILFMFFLGGVAALVVRTELWGPTRVTEAGAITGQLLASADAKSVSTGNDWYNRFFTLHGAIMVFMVIVPSIPASLGNFFLPLMLGAKDVAFPRLNLLSWYIYVIGSIFAVVSIIWQRRGHRVDVLHARTQRPPTPTTGASSSWSRRRSSSVSARSSRA